MKRPRIEDIYTLSPMQEGLLFHALYEPDSRAYFVQTSFVITGEFQRKTFEETWHMLFKRHDILRTAFMHKGQSRPVQVVVDERMPQIGFTDLNGLSTAKQRKRIEAYQHQDIEQGFDLQRDVLLRLMVFHLGEKRYEFILSYHHILLDGWSFGVLQREFLKAYHFLLNGKAPHFSPAPRYRQYIRWLENQNKEEARAYWSQYISDYQAIATLPKFRTDSKPSKYLLKEDTFELDYTVSEKLRLLAAQQGVTLNSLIQCLWGVLLSRYNNTDDVIFGTIVSGRPSILTGVEEIVGLFINAVPVRIFCGLDKTFSAVLKDVQKKSLESEPFHYFSLAEIQAQRAYGHDLFDHIVVFENYPVDNALHQDGTMISERVHIEMLKNREQTHYNVNVVIIPGDMIAFKITYNGLVYQKDQIEMIIAHFRTTALHASEQPDTRINSLNILPDKERNQVVYEFNQTFKECQRTRTVVDWFEAQVQREPNALALKCQNLQLTYHDLNVYANRIAHYLKDSHHIQAEMLIGVLLDRSEWMVVAIWGILKAGAAYVPIDPDYPRERIRDILEDSQCSVILSKEEYLIDMPSHFASRFVDIRSIQCDRTENLTVHILPNHLAYVIYTSGSTGKPKGCQVEHKSLFHYLEWANRYYFNDNIKGHFGLYSSLSFDLTVTSLFLPLLRGKVLHVFSQKTDVGDILIEQFGEGSEIDCIKLTPSHISLLQHLDISSTDIGLAIVGGEALHIEQVRFLRTLNPDIKVYNEYGPTETTVGCIIKHIEPEDDCVLIGVPIDNMHIYILNTHLSPVPIGVPGEIYIGGPGVSRGYLNREALNQERFVKSPFLEGEVLYKSGDIGCWLMDGNIDLLGRNDDQIKIRGYRVELGEIENQLLSHHSISMAAVITRAFGGHEAVLIAYIVDQDELEPKALQDYLADKLPAYMIPSYFVKLEKIPLTPNGKINKRALPNPAEVDLEPYDTYVAPRNYIEEQLALLWKEVLQIEKIGIHDRFFDLGGHSLKATQLVSRLHKTLEVKISLRDFFNAPTIAQLAFLIMKTGKTRFSEISPAPRQAYYTLSHAQKRLWMLYQMGSSLAYNIPVVFRFNNAIEIVSLEKAFASLIKRHETLRTAFVELDGEPKEKVFDHVDFSVKQIDLSDLQQAESRAREVVEQEAMRPFDLTKPPLLRVSVIKLSDTSYVFLLTMHHIIGDGWSLNILFREIKLLYEAYKVQKPNPLKPLRIQYKDFAHWQNAWDMRQDEAYWLNKLQSMPDQMRLPYDFPPVQGRDFSGQNGEIILSAEITQGLRNIAMHHNTTLSNVVLALFKLFLFKISKQKDICVGMGIANRNHPDLEHLIGFFVNLLPIRTQLSDDMEFKDLLKEVIQNTYEALEHQDYPFDLLIQKLNPGRSANRQPIVNVTYGFQNYSDIHIDIEASEGAGAYTQTQQNQDEFSGFQSFEFSYEISKFDLTLIATDTGETLTLCLEYDTSLFKPETINRYLKILEKFARMLAT